jgi:hypothetical protein
MIDVTIPAVHPVPCQAKEPRRVFDQMTMDEDEARVFNALDVVVRGVRGACSAFCLFRSVACAPECSVCNFDVEGQAGRWWSCQ